MSNKRTSFIKRLGKYDSRKKLLLLIPILVIIYIVGSYFGVEHRNLNKVPQTTVTAKKGPAKVFITPSQQKHPLPIYIPKHTIPSSNKGSE